MANDHVVLGKNANALFSLKLFRGDGMLLLGMNWKVGTPSDDFVGFSIEYKEPGGDRFFALSNRIAFPGVDLTKTPNEASSLRSPFQKFRWVHFPFHPELPGEYTYKVKPVFMDAAGQLSYGEAQTAGIELRRETWPGELNVTFTRGFVSSQAFVRKFGGQAAMKSLIPKSAKDGLTFDPKPPHPTAKEAYDWMGFEARNAILEVLDDAIKDKTAKVRFVGYDLNLPEIVDRLKQLKKRVRVIIDSSSEHFDAGAAENTAADEIVLSAGAKNVKRQKMGALQHNKMIVVEGDSIKRVVCGSTNFSWRGFFIQNNNAIILSGQKSVDVFGKAFEEYWKATDGSDGAESYGLTGTGEWQDLGLPSVDAKATFSPHARANARLDEIAKDLTDNTKSSLFFSLAFLYQTSGSLRDGVTAVTLDDSIFVIGISDHPVKGLDVQTPDGNWTTMSPSALVSNVPEPFKSEPTGLAGNFGTRMHHKFLVIDFDKPTARVYMGSYNFSPPADTSNGENLLLIKDRRVATSYMVQALSMFDHYQFRILQNAANKAGDKITLKLPPRLAGEEPWWKKDYIDPRRIKDRLLFSNG